MIGTNHILIVDDDQAMLKILSKYLEDGEYRVDLAQSGEEALKSMKSSMPELIIADVMMPGMNGYELCRKVRSEGNDDIPFIFCSALGELPERIKGLWVGADDYIVKPVNSTELLLKVRRLIDKSRKLREIKSTATEMSHDSVMSGNLENIKIAELLQIVNLMDLSQICLTIMTPEDMTGDIYVNKKQLVHASTDNFSGIKAFSRILGWEKGTYNVEKKTWPDEPTLSGYLEERLLEVVTQLDEYVLLRDAMKLEGCTLKINDRPELLTRQLGEKTRLVLNYTRKSGNIDSILDASPLTDLETLRIINELITTDMVNVSGGN